MSEYQSFRGDAKIEDNGSKACGQWSPVVPMIILHLSNTIAESSMSIDIITLFSLSPQEASANNISIFQIRKPS